jgi:hypothetical protein
MPLFSRSVLVTALFLISRLPIEPLATAYEVPPREMKTATVAITLA